MWVSRQMAQYMLVHDFMDHVHVPLVAHMILCKAGSTCITMALLGVENRAKMKLHMHIRPRKQAKGCLPLVTCAAEVHVGVCTQDAGVPVSHI